jgi:5-methylcytosine-specific restriction protein A
MCEREGRLTAATVVDHITPHRSDPKLFWDPANHQAICKPHHDSTKQRQEVRGYVAGSTVDGRPLDPDHPWNRSR